MDIVEDIQYRHALQYLTNWQGLLFDAQKMLGLYFKRTSDEDGELRRLGAILSAYLTHDRKDEDGRLFGWKPRIAEMQRHLPPRELVELACLYPGISQPKPFFFLKERSKGYSKDKLESASEWLAWSSGLLECIELVSPDLQRRLIGHAPVNKGLIDSFATLVQTLPVKSRPRDDELELCRVYRSLEQTQGSELAWVALNLLASGKEVGSVLAEDIFKHLACLVPDSLPGCYVALAQARLLYPGYLFRKADPAARDLLLSATSAYPNADHMLTALAWIGDEVVQEKFRQWRREPPVLPSTIYVTPDQYSYHAGWELSSEGSYRQLHHEQCVRLARVEKSQKSERFPIRTGKKLKEVCGCCGNPLTALFDLYVREPQIAFLGRKGPRLVIPACLSCWARTFSEVDSSGGALWNPASTSDVSNEAREYIPAESVWMTIERPARSSLEPKIEEGSWLGGHPDWLQDAEYPNCPRCSETMIYVGQVDLGELGGDGIAYAFLCEVCPIAASVLQCT